MKRGTATPSGVTEAAQWLFMSENNINKPVGYL